MIVLIENPPFTFLKQPCPEKVSSFSIERCALRAFAELKLCFAAVKTTICLNATYMGSILFDVLHSQKNSEAVALVVGLWAVGVVIATIWGSVQEYLRLRCLQPQRLKAIVDPRINPDHLKAQDLSIRMEGVPDHLKVRDLLTQFDRINFTNPQALGYLDLKKIKNDNGHVFSKEEWRSSLEVFVAHIENKSPFIGTPPAGSAKLYQFYDQLTSAVCASMHLAEDPDQMASLVMNCALAGEYCGARYMGEVMENYLLLSRGGSGTLQERLLNGFAIARTRLAQSHIQMYYGNDTHLYSAYMAHVGPLVGIPGTQNVVEHLERFNPSSAVSLFLDAYNKEFILKVARDLLKTEAIRELAVLWFKDHARDWKTLEYAAKEKDFFASKTIEEPFPKVQALMEVHHLLIKNPSLPLKQQPLRLRRLLAGSEEFLMKSAEERERFIAIQRQPSLVSRLNRIGIPVTLESFEKQKDQAAYIKDQFDLARRSEFFSCLLTAEGELKQEALEWLLIEHGILT